jgi:acyl-coenzyme A synthetase/AMP-(fatty) acid ligase
MLAGWLTFGSGRKAPSHVFYVEGYPKTASGKIQKFKLRELGVELLKGGGVEA